MISVFVCVPVSVYGMKRETIGNDFFKLSQLIEASNDRWGRRAGVRGQGKKVIDKVKEIRIYVVI